jgi:DNA-binding LytR/AlgR family response regulator
MVKVILDEILFIESLKDYIKIVRQGQKPLLVKQSISSLEDMLPENLFVRIHRSYIVAINKLTAYTNNDVEINENIIPIGKLYSKQVSRFSKK